MRQWWEDDSAVLFTSSGDSTNRTHLVNLTATGAVPPAGISTGNVNLHSISPDGRYVGFGSADTGFVVPDLNAASDTFVRALNWSWTLFNPL